MVTAKTLLDPTARDPELRAFAYLQARFVKGARSAIDCLQPFVLFALGQFNGEVFDRGRVIGFLADSYQLHIPRYMLEEMVPRLAELGALRQQSMADLVTCHNIFEDDAGADGEIDFSLEQISEAEDALGAFASRQGIKKPYSSGNWGEALVTFFQADTSNQKSKPSIVDGLLVTDTAYFDNKIVAEFVIDAYRNGSPIYPIIEKVFYGVLVSEFLVRIENIGNKTAYNGLGIIYDTTVLLRLLGTSGSYLRTATLEMHEVLHDLGCQTYYYNHNYTEMLNALDYIIEAYRAGDSINAETQQALNAGEITIGKISALYTSPDVPLGQLGITEHPEKYEDRKRDEFQINEQGFADELKTGGRYRFGTAAPDYDAKSLGLTMRLRRGKTTRNVADAQAIMVTHNSFFARKSRRYLNDEDVLPPRAIGPILTVGQMTTVGWLANEIIFEPLRVSKELIANCYRASLPMDGWSNAFWDMLKEADPATAEEITTNAVLVRSVQEIALHETKGHIGLIKKLNMNEILSQAEAKSTERETQARSIGRVEGRDTALADAASSDEERAKAIASSIARGVEIVLFLSSVVCLVLSYFFFSVLGVALGFIVSAVLVALGVISFADIFKIRFPFSLKQSIERQSLKVIRETLSFLRGRPTN